MCKRGGAVAFVAFLLLACIPRFRGGGRGISGRASNSPESSYREGMGVVRALMKDQHACSSK